jgi:type II secretory pathway pseudopilin PulG
MSMRRSRSSLLSRRPAAFSIIELILVVCILSAAVAFSLTYLPPADMGRQQRDCDLARQRLQVFANQHFSQTGSWPSRELSELSVVYTPESQLHCPCSQHRYQMSGAIIMCPKHEPTRK